MINTVREIIDYAGASVLLVILLIVTKKTWAWWIKIIFIFFWAIITWYFVSVIPAYYYPTEYNSILWVWIRWISTILWFMSLVYIFEKDIITEVLDRIKNKELPQEQQMVKVMDSEAND